MDRENSEDWVSVIVQKRAPALLTCEEILLGVDKVVRGLVDLDLALPRLGHVPHAGVTGDHVELKYKAQVSVTGRPVTGEKRDGADTYRQHLGLQQRPVLHAAGGVHVQQLAFDVGGVACRETGRRKVLIFSLMKLTRFD